MNKKEITLAEAKKEIKKIIGPDLKIRTEKYSEFGGIFITDNNGKDIGYIYANGNTTYFPPYEHISEPLNTFKKENKIIHKGRIYA
jgi:hypothetical protein